MAPLLGTQAHSSPVDQHRFMTPLPTKHAVCIRVGPSQAHFAALDALL